MKKYKLHDKVKFGIACEIGEWVKYSEAKEEALEYIWERLKWNYGLNLIQQK